MANLAVVIQQLKTGARSGGEKSEQFNAALATLSSGLSLKRTGTRTMSAARQGEDLPLRSEHGGQSSGGRLLRSSTLQHHTNLCHWRKSKMKQLILVMTMFALTDLIVLRFAH